jgi:integrase
MNRENVFYFCSVKSNSYIIIRAPKGFDGYPLRRAHYCTSRRQAVELRQRIKRWKAEQKSPTDTLSFDDYDKRWLAYLRAHVGNLELLPEIVSHWERTAKTVTNPTTLETLARAFVLYRKTKKLSRTTLADDRYIARRLVAELGNKFAHEVTRADIRKLLDQAPSQSTARKIYKIASLIFDHGKENGALAIHPMADMDRPEVAYVIPGTLTPSQFGTLLCTAESKFPDQVPFLALAGFAGIRRAELLKRYADDQVLQWSDIDWDKRLVVVRDGVAKATQRKLGNRRFIPMEDALVHWLLPYRQNDGPIVSAYDNSFHRRTKKLHDAAKIHPSQNALRHSYASYWLARSEDGVGALAKRMGNSESIARRHYVESLSPDEGRSWFSIRRAKRKRSAGASFSRAVKRLSHRVLVLA